MTRDEVVDLFLVKLCEQRKAAVEFIKNHGCVLYDYEIRHQMDHVFLTIRFKHVDTNEIYGAACCCNVSFIVDMKDENIQSRTVEVYANYLRHHVLQNAVRVLKSKEGKRNDTR